MKKLFSLIVFSAMLIGFSACESQPGMLAGGIFKNMFNVPNWFSSADEEYGKLKNSRQYQEDVLSYCRDNANDKYTSLQKIKDSLCQCMPWGSCDKGSCSCDILCPTDFKIFNRNPKVTDQTILENSMAFTNGSSKFYDEIQGYRGFCWGHANLTSKFNRLAVFDSSKAKLYQSDEIVRANYYKDIIKKVANNEPVDIPGFKNLYEFSSDPEVQELLMSKVGEIWSKNASSYQGLKSVMDNTGLSKSDSNSLVLDIENRLMNNQQPSLLFNKKGEMGSAHVVLVQKIMVDPLDNQKYICIRDNNTSPRSHQDCGNRLKVHQDGSLIACRYSYDREARMYRHICETEVGHASITHNENRDAVDQVKNLHTKCASDKDCPKKI